MKYYDFVPSCGYEKYVDRDNIYSGSADIELTAITPLFVGSSSVNSDKDILYREFTRRNGQCFISGASVKGVIKNIASAISHSCLHENEIKNSIDITDDEKSNEQCIICNMFGKLGYKSHILFDDLLIVGGNTAVLRVKQQHTPQITSDYLNDKGELKGQKFYCKSKITPGVDLSIETVSQGAKFKGTVRFKKLSERELCLLFFAMGLDGSFNPQVGGFKNQGLGECRIEVPTFHCEPQNRLKKHEPKALAAEYLLNYADAKIKVSIDKLREIRNHVYEEEVNGK